MKHANGLESIFGRFLTQIESTVVTMKSTVDEQADNISNALNIWKTAKYHQVC